MRHLFWYSKGMAVLGLGGILFGIAYDINHNKQVDKKIAEMNARGAGIWINDKDGKMKHVPMG